MKIKRINRNWYEIEMPTSMATIKSLSKSGQPWEVVISADGMKPITGRYSHFKVALDRVVSWNEDGR